MFNFFSILNKVEEDEDVIEYFPDKTGVKRSNKNVSNSEKKKTTNISPKNSPIKKKL